MVGSTLVHGRGMLKLVGNSSRYTGVLLETQIGLVNDETPVEQIDVLNYWDPPWNLKVSL